MQPSVIEKIYAEFKETKQFTLPAHLIPAEQGYNLLCWMQELLHYYDTAGFVVRPFDELPPLRLSARPELVVTAQDVHRFIINDLNLIPPRVRRMIFSRAVSSPTAQEAWQQVLPMIAALLPSGSQDDALEDLSWRFSPVAELLIALTWIFMERLQVAPPAGARMSCSRFPYYRFLDRDGEMNLWEPEEGLCRWERLAFDVYLEWQSGRGE